jgi:ABC-type Fe3+/spermidine/putrescine transport system ATPase subunit
VAAPQIETMPGRPVALTVERLRVGHRPGSPVVHDVDLTVAAGTLTALLGPSGCGKTTLLKAVAGLLAPDSGEVRVDGRSISDVPAERRPVGLVFQKPLLFGHLSVGDNIAFGLRMSGQPRRARRARVAQMLELVQLTGLAGRRPGELSGGQEQRVALARALVLDPQVLLLDEPFSQLDADLRVRMRDLVRRIQRELGITTLFVTHDQQEAVDVADRIALMFGGRIEADGAPAEFYSRPATLAAARFFGGTNEIQGAVSGSEFSCALGRLRVPPGLPDGPGVLVVRPEALRLVGPPDDAGRAAGSIVAGIAGAVRFRGTHQSAQVHLRGGVDVTITLPPGSAPDRGEQVAVQFPISACHVLSATGYQERPHA